MRRRRESVLFSQGLSEQHDVEHVASTVELSAVRTKTHQTRRQCAVHGGLITASSGFRGVSAATAALRLCLDRSHATAAPGLYLTTFHMLFMNDFKQVPTQSISEHSISCAAPGLQPTIQCRSFHFKQHNHYYRFHCFYSAVAIESFSCLKSF